MARWCGASHVARAVRYMEEPELGRLRWCARCGEWWPLDPEFWRVARHRTRRATLVCLACQRAANRLSYERRMAKRIRPGRGWRTDLHGPKTA